MSLLKKIGMFRFVCALFIASQFIASQFIASHDSALGGDSAGEAKAVDFETVGLVGSLGLVQGSHRRYALSKALRFRTLFRYGCRDKDAVARNDRRRPASARNIH